MKTKYSLLLLYLVICFHSFGQQFQWVNGGGSTSDLSSSTMTESAYFSCTDFNRNIYVLSEVGNSSITVDTFFHNAYGSQQNVMFTSYNCEGQLRFAKLIASANGAMPQGIVADTQGHIYLAASLMNASSTSSVYIGFDTTFSGAGYLRQAIIQYDTSGEFNWIRYVGTNTFVSGTVGGKFTRLTLDNNYYPDLICPMYSSVVLSPTVTSVAGYYDLKYSPTGSLLSAKRLQLDSASRLFSVNIEKTTGKLYIVGANASTEANFIAAFDINRNILWRDSISGTSFGTVGLVGVEADDYGHVYIAGHSSVWAAYHGDTIRNAYPSGNYISFVLKLGTDNSVKWFRNYSSTISVNQLFGLTLMPGNKLAICGTIAGQLSADGDTILSYAGEGQNAFFSILDTSSHVHTIQQIHGGGFYDISRSVCPDRTGNLYISGFHTIDVWAGSLSPMTAVGGYSDFNTLKYGVDCNCISMPVASFNSSGFPTVNFSYTGTTASTDSIRWTFGDGGTSSSLTPTHSYASPGHYTACVHVYSSCGNDEACRDIYIPCVTAPVAAFTSSGITATRNFTYTGTTVGLDSVVWNYGDGGHGTGTSISHTYASPGTYSACVTVYSPCGSNTSCSTIIITCITAPVASFTNSGAPITSFTYTGTTTGLDSVSWRYGDGAQGSGLTSVHNYTLGGTYTACAIAYNHCGWDSACVTVVVPCVPPVANFSHTGTLVQNFGYTGTTPGIDSIVWDYGDGNAGHGSTTSHTYMTEGTYHVCVTAYSYCASDTFCNDIVITCPAPVAAITNINDTFHYTGTTPTIDSIVWDFGDGFTDTGISPIHPYAVTDTYHVCVRVYGYCGADTLCSDFIVTGVGISMVSIANVSVYPNPATNQVNIEGVTSLMNYRLINVTGVTLQQGELRIGTNRVNMSNYSPGVYMIELIGGDGSRRTFRVVKE